MPPVAVCDVAVIVALLKSRRDNIVVFIVQVPIHLISYAEHIPTPNLLASLNQQR